MSTPDEDRAADALGTGIELEEEAAGWEAIAELTGGIPPESVQELRAVRELDRAYPLLHAVVGRSLRDFLVRAAALEAIVVDGRPCFSSQDIAQVLYWLDDQSRDRVLLVLRQSGWVIYDAVNGTSLTDAGRWIYDVLSFLHRKVQESELMPTVAGVQYALRLGVDPLRHLQSMRSRLEALRHEMEMARGSYSEVVIKAAASKVQDATHLSEQIREVVEQVPLDNRAARAIVREVSDLLSRLHVGASDLHAAATEVGRQYLRLTAGLTPTQIVEALMKRSCDELATVAREALLPVIKPVPLLTTSSVGAAAERQFSTVHGERATVQWTDPPEAPRQDDAIEIPEDARALLDDLFAIARGDIAVPLSEFVPRRSAGESFLRASLLALAGERQRGEGFTGRLGAVETALDVSGDGWPEQTEGTVLARLSPGEVRPARQGGH